MYCIILTLTFILESSVLCNLPLNLPELTGTRVPLSQRSSDIWLVIGRNVFILPTWSGCWQALGGIQLIPSLSLCRGQTFMRPLKVNNLMRRYDIRWPSDSISAEKSDRCPHFSPILFRYYFMSLWQSYNFTISVFGCKLLKPQSVCKHRHRAGRRHLFLQRHLCFF
jgi:hypothetical protein